MNSNANLYHKLPDTLPEELFTELLRDGPLRIERILSRGHSSPETGWYDQAENEWVLLLQGAAELQYEDGSSLRLATGDYVHIPAHTRHRLSWTDPAQLSIWLAVFYR